MKDQGINIKIKRIFLTGLAVVIPIGLTIYILIFIVQAMDELLNIIPENYQPDTLLGFHIPGLGIIITVILIFGCGLVTTSYFGKRLVSLGERIVGRIPFVRSLYGAIKRIAENLLVDRSQSFKRVVLVEYPRPGIHSIGFITCSPDGKLQQCIDQEKSCVGVYLPCALTPTTGVFVIVPRKDVVEINMTVEEAFTLIISAGIVTPQASREFNGKTVGLLD
jgi:uncharacterized membrane protein